MISFNRDNLLWVVLSLKISSNSHIILYYNVGEALVNPRFTFNLLKPNGISNYYQLDQFISVLRIVGWYFSFLFKFERNIL